MTQKYCKNCSESVLQTILICPKCGSRQFQSTPLAQPKPPKPTQTYVQQSSNSSTNLSSKPRQSTNSRSNLIPIIALCCTVIFFVIYPIINEQAHSTCHALEKRALNIISSETKTSERAEMMLGSAVITAITNGEIAALLIKQVYPLVPPFLGCSLAYWRLMLDKNSINQLLDPLQTGLKI